MIQHLLYDAILPALNAGTIRHRGLRRLPAVRHLTISKIWISVTARIPTKEPPFISHRASRRASPMPELLSGKEMSFNNYVDADAAWQLVCDFDELACAIIKHTNPAGVGLGATAEEAYRKALATDPVSAFGGIVAFNRTVDEEAARAVTEIFTEVIIAPEYTTRRP